MKLPHFEAAQILVMAKIGVGVVAGVLEVRGHLTPQFSTVLVTLIASLGVSSLANTVGAIVQGKKDTPS